MLGNWSFKLSFLLSVRVFNPINKPENKWSAIIKVRISSKAYSLKKNSAIYYHSKIELKYVNKNMF